MDESGYIGLPQKGDHWSSKILFILESNKVQAYLECVKSYAWSFGHSAPDPSSVKCV